ncbi:NAD(P)-dependent oxidoreductase [Ktedonosporobacter rubrisoli]|uniref:NAD(P)-dependent oxidoreductase n=1 Tax=Ktedonosporobacter rubrisoli TaxID=2509675 RepID=A0A4P6K533_KTERU|nr:NAD(P)-dependent oxidoreductase [Ktedonosporobacter rubrisoli]
MLTGAAGGIGSAFFRSSAEQFHFRLADRNITALGKLQAEGHEIVELDIADLDACQQACRDMDIVIHLAADPNPEADFLGSLLHNNIQGTYNMFRAARDQGCQRVIFASSVQTLLGYPDDVQPQVESLLRPVNMYGVSKCFGEAVAYYFAHTEGLSSIVVRIGAYDTNGTKAQWLLQHKPHINNLSGYVSERDLNQLLTRCIETPDISYAIVHGISNNLFKKFEIESTRALLGYAPQDDAFKLFKDQLQGWLQD